MIKQYKLLLQLLIVAVLLLLFASCEEPKESPASSRIAPIEPTIRHKQPKTIVFSTSMKASTNIYRKARSLYQEAFRRLGYHFELISQPVKRSLYDANNGTTDGESGRIADLVRDTNFPNLLRIDESIIDMNVTAYTTNQDIAVNSWEDFKGKGYVVGIRKGIKITELRMLKVVTEDRIIKNTGIDQNIRMLLANRIDMFVDIEDLVDCEIQQKNESRIKAIRKAGNLETVSIYPYFHKNYSFLARDLANTIKQMKTEKIWKNLTSMPVKLNPHDTGENKTSNTDIKI